MTTRVRPKVLAAVAGVLMTAACSGSTPAATDQPQGGAAAVPVTAVRARLAELAEGLDAGGVVAAGESALVSSRVVATVRTVRVRAGDQVRAGDVLVTLDARDLAAQSRQAAAAVIAAEHALGQARSEQAAAAAESTLAAAWHSRIAALRARNSATPQELDEAEARLAAATARSAGAQAGIDQAAARLESLRAASDAASIVESFSVVRAPFDGTITERLTDPGNLATPGTPLVSLDASGPRRVEVDVDEARASYVRPGDHVTVAIDAPGESAGEQTFDGTVTEVARTISHDRRAFTVKVLLPAAVNARTGTFARVTFRGAVRRALVVPASAVQRQGQVTSVFVAENGRARLRLVRLGSAGAAEGVEIAAGLAEGDMVVAAPPPTLRDGAAVSVREVTNGGGRT